MKIILAMLISLGLCFAPAAFADKHKVSDGKYSCNCSKYKHKQKTTKS